MLKRQPGVLFGDKLTLVCRPPPTVLYVDHKHARARTCICAGRRCVGAVDVVFTAAHSSTFCWSGLTTVVGCIRACGGGGGGGVATQERWGRTQAVKCWNCFSFCEFERF